MNSKFKINDIVQIIKGEGSNKNLFGKINGMEFETVDGVIKCIGIQIIIDIQNQEILMIDPYNLTKFVDQNFAKTVFMLQNLTGDNLRNALSFLSFTDLFNIYCLKNLYINDAFNAREAIKIDFRNSTSDFLLEIFPKYKQLYSTQNKISNIFDILIELTYLEVDYHFNKPLGDSLHNLKNLKTLTFGFMFKNGDQPLSNSLSTLINLESLILGASFSNGNQPLGDSLKNLRNLKTLCFGSHFTNNNQPLDDSLSTLVNLERLILGYYFGLYNKQLGNSLHNLKNLRILSLGHSFNSHYKLIGNSFEGLINLEILELGYHYDRDIELGDILEDLINLKEINGRPYKKR